jgi:hypothetical protein
MYSFVNFLDDNVSVRFDKIDITPQPKIIEMLKSL